MHPNRKEMMIVDAVLNQDGDSQNKSFPANDFDSYALQTKKRRSRSIIIPPHSWKL